MRICILGDTGLLGQAFIRHLVREHVLLGISTSKMPSATHPANYNHHIMDVIREEKRLQDQLTHFRPELIVNCAALADIGRCEKEPELARLLNADLPQKMAELAKSLDADLIHISTDAIFGQPTNHPHKTTDTPIPCNVYGKTKIEGEMRVLKQKPDSLIARTNIVGFRDRIHQPTFGEWLCHALHEQQEVILADDFITNSIHVDLFVPLLLRLQQEGAQGLFHVVSADALSKYEFGRRLALKIRADFSKVQKGCLADLNLMPPRAPYLAMDITQTEQFLGQSLPTSEMTIARLAGDFLNRIASSTQNHALYDESRFQKGK